MRINKISMQGGKSNLWFMEKKHAICYDESADRVRGYTGKGGFVMSDFNKSEIVVLAEKGDCVTVDSKKVKREKVLSSLAVMAFHLLPFAIVFVLFFIPSLLIMNWLEGECFSEGILTFARVSFGIVIVAGLIGTLIGKLEEPEMTFYNVFCGVFTGGSVALIITALVVVLALLFLIVAVCIAAVMALVAVVVGVVYLALYFLPFVLGIGFIVLLITAILGIDAICQPEEFIALIFGRW